MLAHIATLLTVAFLLLIFAGLGLAAERLTRNYLLAKVAAPAALVASLFCLEHFAALGSLRWVWPLAIVASAAIVVRRYSTLCAQWRTEVLFAGAFAYGFLWRYFFPDIDGQSEKLADLALINSFTAGGTLPPVDSWFPPYPLDVYYALQHYAVALLVRLLGCEPGFAYNLGVALMVGLIITCAGGAVAHLTTRRWQAGLLLGAFVLGGTGAVPFVHLIKQRVLLSDNMRFIGGSATPQQVNTPFGRWLAEASGVPEREAVELPAETFAYLAQLGDFHPPLSGFFLLTLALLCIALTERDAHLRVAEGVLAATVPLTLASNAWSFPLQVLLVTTWAGCRIVHGPSPRWKYFGGGLAAGAFLVHPFLMDFGYRSLDYNTALRWVPAAERTPLLLGLIVLYPVIVVLLLCWLGRGSSMGVWLAALWIGCLVFSELFYIDDVYSGRFNRFNSTLKWWPWIWAGVLLTTAAQNLKSASRVCRVGTVVVLVAATSYAVDLGAYFLRTPKPHAGRLNGAGWITADRTENAIFEYLKAQPRAIVLQRPVGGAFVPSPGMVTLTGHNAFLGWPGHEKLWRGNQALVELRRNDVRLFYEGRLEGSEEWLIENGIEHVLWLKEENTLPAGTFESIQARIQDRYYWRQFHAAGSFRIGVWSRRGG